MIVGTVKEESFKMKRQVSEMRIGKKNKEEYLKRRKKCLKETCVEIFSSSRSSRTCSFLSLSILSTGRKD